MTKKFLCLLMTAMSIVTCAAASAHLFTGSNSHINQITQDHAGYIWIATDNGLTRFDGHNTKTFTRSGESPSLLNNIVLSVIEDSKNDIWVGTYDGIQKFNRDTETFETPRLNYPGVPEFTYISSIIEDSKGNLWFTTSRSGVICFTAGERKPIWYITTNSAISSDNTGVVFEDKFGNIWIGTNDKGITVYNPTNHTMTRHSHIPADESTLSGNMITDIIQGDDGQLYISSLDGGIDSYNFRTHKFTRNVIPVPGKVFVLRNHPGRSMMYVGTDGDGLYAYDLEAKELTPMLPAVQQFDIRHAKIHDIIVDREGNIWASVYQRGALMIPARTDEIEDFGFNPFSPRYNIGSDPVLSIMKDSKGRLWIGTDGDGIYRRDIDGNFHHISGSALESNVVMSLLEDSRGEIWAGTYYGGISRYNEASGSFTPAGIEIDGRRLTDVNTIAEDSRGRLWLGTNGNGIVIYNPADGSIERIFHRNDTPADRQILGNSIHSILFDQKGNTWIGTSDAGLSRLDSRTGLYEHYNLINRRLNNNCVYSIVEDSNGNIWVATSIGLVCISDGKSTFYNESHGVPAESIYSMELDNDGNLWLAATDNLTEFNINTQKTVRHHTSPLLESREFKRGASFIDETGRMYFGGVGGVVSFNPDSFNSHRTIRNVELQEAIIGETKDSSSQNILPLKGMECLELPHDYSTFRVTFGAMEFNNPDEVEYFVKLDGLNDDWMPVAKGSQSVTFSKIPAGNYTLRVRAQLGTSKAETSLPVRIRPVFYLTWWAKCIYVIMLLALIAAQFIITRKRNARKAEHIRMRQEEKNTEDKLQFFTDIAHEVRTPLTLILSPITSLKRNTADKRTLAVYEMMESNGARILRIIDQVIDLRKVDSKSMRLQVTPTDIRSFIASLTASFSQAVANRNITFTTRFSDEVPQTVLLDCDKIDKVVFNVIANALRFTPDGGKVEVMVDIDGTSNLRIRVSDTGPGVPEDVREKIFERFYQAKSRHRSGGTGIGLHLSRKMMDAHHGSIFVEDSSPAGSTFAIIIPLLPDAYTPEEVGEAEAADHPRENVHIAPEQKEATVRLSTARKPHTLLIVEDDVAILDYLSSTLSADYNILTATDGTKGLEMALRFRPQCIITDVMMDGMDGLEMCRKIRANSGICEIPIIILTAKAAEAHRLEGIEAGADAYIVKPFNIDILRAQVTRLIHSRRVIKQKLSKNEAVNEKVAAMKSGDEKLLERVEAVVVKELANPDLNVEYIAAAIGVSRSHLHRRLKELTNVSPSTYIKQARMRHAVILLTEKHLTVSEAAYATGFNTLSHFSTAFKDFYGMSPTHYVVLNAQNDNSENIEDES